jgi:hypothetical protein
MNPEFSPESPNEVLKKWEETGTAWHGRSIVGVALQILLPADGLPAMKPTIDITDAARLSSSGSLLVED